MICKMQGCRVRPRCSLVCSEVKDAGKFVSLGSPPRACDAFCQDVCPRESEVFHRDVFMEGMVSVSTEINEGGFL